MRYGIPAPGYRLPGETRLGSARLLVSDLERSLEYYQQVIGFRVVSRERTTVTLGPQGGDSALIHLETRPGTKSPPRGGRFGLYHFALLLPDRASLGRYVKQLAETGAHMASAD